MKIEETQELSRRAATCKGWRWLPGMLIQDWASGIRYFWADDKWFHGIAEKSNTFMRITPAKSFPDLTDPATLGCLMQLVREAYADQCACVFPIDYGPAGVMWQVRLTASGRQVTARHYTTEAEALVAALEAVQ